MPFQMVTLTNSHIYTKVKIFSLMSLELNDDIFCKLILPSCFQPYFKSTK